MPPVFIGACKCAAKMACMGLLKNYRHGHLSVKDYRVDYRWISRIPCACLLTHTPIRSGGVRNRGVDRGVYIGGGFGSRDGVPCFQNEGEGTASFFCLLLGTGDPKTKLPSASGA